jgi:shikimate 5-dehydrogenase
MINKDTQIYCSFSKEPGNNGCNFFNSRFKESGINAIYKSFYCSDISKSIEAVKTLDIKGFAVSMPFKIDVLSHVDEMDEHTKIIGSANTITNDNGYLKAYNTDWVAVRKLLEKEKIDHLTILGNGGFSKSVQYFCETSKIPFDIINRRDWDRVIKLEGFVFNATPVEVFTEGILIDGRPCTAHGSKISELQAEEQYKIYINDKP